jgi:hypothetical protein
MLPIYQVRNSQTRAAERLIEPDAEVVPRHLRRQAGLQARQVVRTRATEAEGLGDRVVDRLDALTDACEPAAPTRGPGPAAVALRRAQHRRPVTRPPAPVRGLPCAALSTEIRPQGGLPDAQASRVWRPAPGEERLGQRRVLGAGGANATTGTEPSRVDRQAPMAAVVPAQAGAPAAIGQTWQPAGAAALGLPGRHRRTVQGVVAPGATGQEAHQVQAVRHDGGVVLAPQAIHLGAMGPRRDGDAPVPWRRTGAGPLAGTAGPLPTEAQGDDLAPAERGLWPGVDRWWEVRRAALINHDVEDGEEGLRVDPGAAPLQDQDWSGTLASGYLPLKF